MKEIITLVILISPLLNIAGCSISVLTKSDSMVANVINSLNKPLFEDKKLENDNIKFNISQ